MELQPVVVLQDKFVYRGKVIRAITYRADFAYFDHAVNKGVIEDVKVWRQMFSRSRKRCSKRNMEICTIYE